MEQKADRKKSWIIVVLLLVILGLCGYIFLSGKNSQPSTEKIDQSQSEYVKPEKPVDRSKNVTLPGWGGFTIPANTRTITEGFEFHNPEENLWYEDQFSIKGEKLEKLVVDSGNQVELNHYLQLAGINQSVTDVTDYDQKCFKIDKSDDGNYTVEAIGGFKGKKTITVKTNKGKEVNLTVRCKEDYYYMTFGLYLSENDELLYQSDLVSPGKYIQKMKMTRALKPGKYDAYVVCQPYRSDKSTKTNQGVVRITLTVK